jgi:hypothetical protein
MRFFGTRSFVCGCVALLGACAAAQNGSPHNVALESSWDAPIVSIAEQAVRGAIPIDHAWPGFWNPVAFAIYRPDTALYLFMTGVAPRDFKPVNDALLPAVLRHSWFVLEGSSRGLKGGVVPIDANAKRLTMAVRLSQGPVWPLEFLLHESFHGWQYRTFASLFDPSVPQHLPDSLRLPANLQHLLETERRLLLAALASKSDSRQAVRDYLAARRARLSDSPRLAGRIEQAAERLEGTAEYVGLVGALAATTEDMDAVVDSVVARIRSDERWGSHTLTPREYLSTRAYRTGSAMALLLARLGCDDWRTRVSGGAFLDAQLDACVGMR